MLSTPVSILQQNLCFLQKHVTSAQEILLQMGCPPELQRVVVRPSPCHRCPWMSLCVPLTCTPHQHCQRRDFPSRTKWWEPPPLETCRRAKPGLAVGLGLPLAQSPCFDGAGSPVCPKSLILVGLGSLSRGELRAGWRGQQVCTPGRVCCVPSRALLPSFPFSPHSGHYPIHLLPSISRKGYRAEPGNKHLTQPNVPKWIPLPSASGCEKRMGERLQAR